MKVVEAHEVKHKIMHYAFFERGHIAVVTEGANNADVLGITKDKLAVEFEVKVSKSDFDKELAAIKYATMVIKEGKNFGPNDDAEQTQLNLELGNLKNKAGGWSKISKHEEYLDPKKYMENHKYMLRYYRYTPNYFYFVMPNRLVPYALEQLKDTGYGVIAFDGCRSEGQHYGYFIGDKLIERNCDDWQVPEGAVWRKGAPCTKKCYQEIAVKQRAKKIHSEKVSENIIMSILNRAVTENIRMLDEIVQLNKSEVVI